MCVCVAEGSDKLYDKETIVSVRVNAFEVSYGCLAYTEQTLRFMPA